MFDGFGEILGRYLPEQFGQWSIYSLYSDSFTTIGAGTPAAGQWPTLAAVLLRIGRWSLWATGDAEGRKSAALLPTGRGSGE